MGWTRVPRVSASAAALRPVTGDDPMPRVRLGLAQGRLFRLLRFSRDSCTSGSLLHLYFRCDTVFWCRALRGPRAGRELRSRHDVPLPFTLTLFQVSGSKGALPLHS